VLRYRDQTADRSANTVSFDMLHCALHVDANAFGNLYIQIDVLTGLRAW